jgi:hypothetical protein
VKILGNTPDGDLIIQVSQAEWDGLQDGVKPRDDAEDFEQKKEEWPSTDAGKLLGRYFTKRIALFYAFCRGEIDGTTQSLRDVADGKIRIAKVDSKVRARLKELLDDNQKEHNK